MPEKIELSSLELSERVVNINRVAKVVKGGKRFNFSALVVVGDETCYVGSGLGKANEISEAIRKATEEARRNIVKIQLAGGTIPYMVEGRCGASRVMLRPASKGTGVIACSTVRAVLELGGVKDILTKSLGSNTATNLVRATMNGLLSIRDPESIEKLRGKTLPRSRGEILQEG
ncbi:30S ribosomal protein S5 [candidate division TA06 bacterium]|uniref:Small ribosomal subunit protein uS5 n=1 Tax=candidate division TA06 bacterium TaxID=2250710 RepID=A0A523UWU6_UNCT6|nr:MAG: 30S ribosomal protein S5 [candidate division TA06 bacterium]